MAVPSYTKQGKCNRCGSCCLACVFLKWDGEIAICGIYGHHPQYCKDFPMTLSDLIEKCGYHFEAV